MLVAAPMSVNAQQVDNQVIALVDAINKPVGGQYAGHPSLAMLGVSGEKKFEFNRVSFPVRIAIQPTGPLRFHLSTKNSMLDFQVKTPTGQVYDADRIRQMNGMVQEAMVPDPVPADMQAVKGLRPGANVVFEVPSSGAGDYLVVARPREAAGTDTVHLSARWMRVADIGDPMQKVALQFTEAPKEGMTYDPLTFKIAVAGLSPELEVALTAEVIKKEEFPKKDEKIGAVQLSFLKDVGGVKHFGTGLKLNAKGTYSLVVTLKRTNIPEGGLQPGFLDTRSRATQFSLDALPARYTGKITERIVDADADTKIDEVAYDIEVEVQDAGEYSVSVLLTAKDNTQQKKTNKLKLEPGIHVVPVIFSAEDLRGLGGGSGPYVLEFGRLLLHGDEGETPMRLVDTVMATRPFVPDELE